MKSSLLAATAPALAALLSSAFSAGARAETTGAPTPLPPMLAPDVASGLRFTPAATPALPAALDVPNAVYWGMFRICVGDSGDVTKVDVLKSTGHPNALDAPWAQLMRTWSYQPRLVDGKPTAFCHAYRMEVASKAVQRTLDLPPEVGDAQLLTDVNLAPYRPSLPPALNFRGMTYWGLFKTCVSSAGVVTKVTVMRSTGEPHSLDERWMETMRKWRYRPYTLNGKPFPFCFPARLQVTAG